MKKSFIFVILCFLFVHNAGAAISKVCPAGLFCTGNGQYVIESKTSDDIKSYQLGPSELVVPGAGTWSDMGLCSDRKSFDSNSSTCRYYASDYDEVWVSIWFGFYAVNKGEVMYFSSPMSNVKGVFACPGTYPSSDVGASSVFQCYRTDSDGKKEYYKAPNGGQNKLDGSYNTDDINVMLEDLQSALELAQTAARNLQNVLKKSNDKIKVSVSYNNAAHLKVASASQSLGKAFVETSIAAPVDEKTNEIKSTTTTQTSTGNSTQYLNKNSVQNNSKDNEESTQAKDETSKGEETSVEVKKDSIFGVGKQKTGLGSFTSFLSDRAAKPVSRNAVRSAINKDVRKAVGTRPVNSSARRNVADVKKRQSKPSRESVVTVQ